jgi:putative phage-type endonuclease
MSEFLKSIDNILGTIHVSKKKKKKKKNIQYCKIVENLLLKPQPEQRSEAWFKARKHKITASSASSCLTNTKDVCEAYINEFKENYDMSFVKFDGKCCNKYGSRQDFMLNKCGLEAKKGELIKREWKGNIATRWGVKYEPIATEIYSDITNQKIIEFGLLEHDTIEWLAASPDGITPQGIMLEIKCPFKRKITGLPPFYYWVQVQLQLEVCNLERCDFLECKFVEMYKNDFFNEDSNKIETKATENLKEINNVKYKGIIVEYRKYQDYENSEFYYPDNFIPYKSKDFDAELIYFEDWANNFCNKIRASLIIQKWWRNNCKGNYCKINEEYTIKKVYWKLDEYNVTSIYRNKDWFKKVSPIFEKAYTEFRSYQDNGVDEIKRIIQDKFRKKQPPKRSSWKTIKINTFFEKKSSSGSLFIDSDSDS